MAIYDRIGKIYDATRRADSLIVSRLAFNLEIRGRGDYLDAACGTGNYTTALAEKFGGKWCGVDQSSQMIEAARAKDAASLIEWRVSDVAALPYDNETFDGAICTLAIHHFKDLNRAFSEIRRVLKKESRFVIFTATPEQTRSYWLAEYFPQAIEESAKWLPDLKMITNSLRRAGFASIETELYAVRENLQDFFLYSGKYKPEMYLDERVRANISTFALLAEKSEIETGCRRLAADIESGHIQSVIERHRQTNDYVFIVVKVRTAKSSN